MELFRVDRSGANSNSRVIWREEQKKYIIEKYLSGMSLKKLSKQFQVHKNTIKKVLQDNDLHIRNLTESRQRENINHNIFSNINTEEKAYWLGFLAADGNVYYDKISCNLQASDRSHLKKMARFFGESEEKVETYTGATPSGGKREYVRLNIFSIQCANDLHKVGIPENKSLILEPPLFLENKNLQYAWIRGYFDGDGALSYSKTQRRVQFYFTGTYAVLKWVCEVLQLNTEPFLEHGCDSTYRISCNGWKQAKRVLDNLYLNATIYLDRKYNLYLKLNVPTEHDALMEKCMAEIKEWVYANREKIMSCKKNKISDGLSGIFEIGKKYNFIDKRTMARNICGSESLKDMLVYLQSVLQQ